MKILSCILALAACILYSGCTAIAVRGPVGDPVSDEVIQQILGTWIGERIDSIDSTVVFERVPDSSFLVARYQEDDEPKEQRFLVTMISDGAIVFWAETDAAGFFAPGRGSLNEHSLIVLIPDNEEVKSLVDKGVLNAAPEEADGLYMIEPKGVEEVMTTKEFWNLDNGLALIKAQVSKKEDGDGDGAGETDASLPHSPQEPEKTQGAP